MFLHETIEACTEASSQTDYFLFRDRRMCVEKKKNGGFIYRKRKVCGDGGGRGFFLTLRVRSPLHDYSRAPFENEKRVRG